ncbi:MAG: YraN family protein [Alphaproteobacteria bacterium]|nr:YraN family protein [Alphaproteobacteria bacterium]
MFQRYRKQRKSVYYTGLVAEALCRLVLRLKGYCIVASRYKTPLGEIDIIAVRADTLAIVEVKARPSLDVAADAVSPRQWGRIFRAASLFVSAHPRFCNHNVRFDCMLVAPWRLPAHFTNQFSESSNVGG